MKKLSIYFLFAIIFAMQGISQAVWNGTASYNWYTTNDGSSPYEIATPEELAGFSNIVNGTDGQTMDHFAGKTVMLTADIYMNAAGFESNLENALQFTPIGHQNAAAWNTAPTNYFAGTFNGNYHYIYNVYIKKDIKNPSATNSERYYAQAGLFGAVNGTVNMQNVILKNMYLEGSTTIGSIIGYYQGNVTLTNCMSINFTFYTSATTDWKMSRAAALVGGTDVSSTLTLDNCAATGGTVFPDWSGALVGQIKGSSTITNCYFYGICHETRIGGNDDAARIWTNNYFGRSSNVSAGGSDDTGITVWSDPATAQANMQNNADFVTQLGAGWRMDLDNVNNGFPVVLLLDANCMTVTGLHATSNTNSTINIEWTAPVPAPSSYNVIWGTAGFSPATGDLDPNYAGSGNTSNSSYSLTGLDEATGYVIAIQSDCGGGMLSPWIALTTGTIAAETYGEEIWHGYVYAQIENTIKTFGDYLGYVEELPQFDRNRNPPALQSAPWTGVNPAWIASAGPSDYFSVRYKMTKNFDCGDYIFTINADDHWRLSMDGGQTWLASHNGATQAGADHWTTACCAAWQTDVISLNGSYNMVLEFTESNGGTYLTVNWTEAPVSITSLAGPYSAELTFSNGTNWNVKVSSTPLANPAVGSADILTVNTSNNPYTLTGLSPSTLYYVYALPTDCGSSWGSHNFTTTVLCAQPYNISVSNIEDVSADITWNAPLNATSFNIVWGTQDFVPGTGTPVGTETVTSPPYQITGLSASTNYVAGIQTDCGSSGTSLWTPISLFTGCGIMALSTMPLSLAEANNAQAPWKEDFSYNDDYQASHNWSVNNQSLPDCWTRVSQVGGGGCAPYIHGGDQRLDFCGFSSGWSAAVMPRLPVEINPIQLKMQFWWHNNNHSGNLKIYLTDNLGSTNLSDYELVGTTTTHDAINSISFANYTGSASMYIAFVCDIGGGLVDNLRVWIDNTVSICAPPTEITVSNTTSTSATVNWTAPSAAPLSYTLEYKQTAASTYTALTGITGTAQTLNGLLCGTSYNIRVKSACGDGTSTYTSTTFTTLACPVCDAPAAVSHSSVTPTGATVTWTPGGTEDAWAVEWKNASAFSWNRAISTMTTYALTGLTAETCYNVRVKAICSPGDSSIWSTPDNFCTPQTACNAPIGLVASSITEHAITVAWQPMNGETDWKVSWEKLSSGNLGSGDAHNSDYSGYPITGLTDSSTYEICIVAVCAQGLESLPACINVMTLDETGIHNITFANRLQLYPNPTTGELRIANYELREGDKIEVYNILGQLQPFSILNPQQLTIDVSHLAAGIYTVKIGGYVGKFVKR